ncbi:MAG: AAA family ATPase [Cetobacterium sp.]|uniref:AAA family ATPase n=1 Tax=Cetobacterium sp. TaxID=2071632 RepID=UPI003EE64E8E
MKWIKFISSLIISYILGFTLSRGLSARNKIEIISSKKEVLSHDLPFIYTVRLNEMLLIYMITLFISFILHMYYKKSKNSQKQIFKLLLGILWIESVAFSFILGTWQEKILTTGESGYIYICSSLIVPAFVYGLVIFCSLSKENESYVFNQEESEDLFESRKNLLLIMEFYLKHSKGFSIVGDWGIGKTKLIENFFEKSKKENGERYGQGYEVVYIDVSTFSDNKKIIYEIEDKFNLIFKKYKILKLEFELMESLFDETTTWIKNLKKLLFEREYFNDSKQDLSEKINELKNNGKKQIVICLDNLERIIDRERIVNLLAIIDDITTDNIRKIYIYDKEHMKLIFDEINFEKYIEKYSDNFIEVKEIGIKEVVKKPEKFDLKRLHFKLKIDQKLEEIKDEDLKKQIIQKKEEIEKIMTNPRKIINIEKHISCKEIKISQESQMEYRILIELFGRFDLNNIVQRSIFFPELTYSYRIKLEEFEALSEGKLILENKKTEQEINEMKIQALKGNAKDIVDYFRYCKENSILNKGKEIFIEIDKYFVDTLYKMEDIIFLMYNDIDIKIDKMEVIYQKKFFSSGEVYSLEETKRLLKIILIKRNLKNFKIISRRLFKTLKDYEEVFKCSPIEFEENLKKINNMDVEKIIVEVENIKNNIKNNLIDLEKLEIELKVLGKINNMKRNILKEKIEFETKLTEDLLLKISDITLSNIFNIKKLRIKVYSSNLELNEDIERKNLKFYKEYFSKMKEKTYLIKGILMEIYLLEERIDGFKIKKRKPVKNKLKKYYKNN